jgi:hypothetical protein
VLQLLVTANAPSLLILSRLMMEALRSSKTLILISATQRHIPEDGILHSADVFIPHPVLCLQYTVKLVTYCYTCSYIKHFIFPISS